MHEYGMVQGVLSQVDESVHANAGKRAVRVVLTVTGMTTREQDVLRDAFDACKAGTVAHDADLELERGPTEAWCPGCGAVTWLTGALCERCPDCGGDTPRPVTAPEIYLTSVEIEV